MGLNRSHSSGFCAQILQPWRFLSRCYQRRGWGVLYACLVDGNNRIQNTEKKNRPGIGNVLPSPDGTTVGHW